MPRVPISDLIDYLEEDDQGVNTSKRLSRKDKKERKESLPPPPRFKEE